MAEPIILPITTDPDEIAEIGLDYLEDAVPGWTRERADPAFQMIMTTARVIAEARDTASDVPPAIFRYQGEWLVGLPPVDAASAQTTATIVMVDNAGYTIDAGTPFEILTAGDESFVFLTSDAVTVLPGATTTATGEVGLVAETAGEDSSGLPDTSTIRSVDTITFIDSVTLEEDTSGGVAAETDDEYLARLVEEFRLFTPRPILPSDFAVLARRVLGVERALPLNLFSPAAVVNQQTTLSITGGPPASGSFGLNVSAPFVEGYATLIAWNATATNVRDALLDMAGLHLGDVTATGGPLPGTPVVLTWAGSMSGQTVTLAVADSTLSAGTADVAITTAAVDGYGVERTITLAVTDENGAAVASGVKTEVAALLNSLREVNFVVNVIDATYTSIDVEFDAVAYAGFDTNALRIEVEAVVAEYLSATEWGKPPSGGPSSEWIDEPIVRYGELYQIVNAVEGVHYVTRLVLARTGDDLMEQDVPLPGPAALPAAGTITGLVTEP